MGHPVGKRYSKIIRYTTTRRIFSLLNRLLLIAKFNLGPKEMERNFILICFPLNKEKKKSRRTVLFYQNDKHRPRILVDF